MFIIVKQLKKMNNLPTEIMVIILEFLDFRSQIRFIFASKTNKCLTKYWTINKKFHINDKIIRWHYYHNLGNIVTHKFLDIYPKGLQHLTFHLCHCISNEIHKLPSEARSIRQNLVFPENEIRRKPSSITRLTLGGIFNRPIDKLPSGARSYWLNPFLIKTDFPITDDAYKTHKIWRVF